MKQTIRGTFVLFLAGIPGLCYSKLTLISERGSEAVGRGFIIGPFLLATVPFPRFRSRPVGDEPCPREICPICEVQKVQSGTCDRPNPGWFCTLEKDHEGSCPAWPIHHLA